MLTSARGPGVIGTILALIVLLGFAGLFMLASDESHMGPSLASVVKSQETDIENLHSRISLTKKNLEALPALEKNIENIENIERTTRIHKGTVTGLLNHISVLRDNIDSLQKELLAYKTKYRAYMRDKAKGEKIEEITTLSGKIYKHVEVREVTPIGMQIRYDEGFKRIPFENLPRALQERFQFDPQEKQDAMKAESSSEQEHFKKVADADAAGQVQASADRTKQNQEDKAKAMSQIASLEAEIKMIDSDIEDLRRQADRARLQTAAGLARGHRILDLSSGFENSILAKKSRRADLLAQILFLKSKL